jgi:succinoglycan biosynthesis transport protein ExoP
MMSRIDEALESFRPRESSHAPAGGEFRLEHYPVERALSAVPSRRRPSADEASPPGAGPRQAVLPPAPHIDAAASTSGTRNTDTDGEPGQQYRKLAATIVRVQPERAIHTVMIASATEYDGKTTAAVRVAQALCDEQGRRVLLLDANLFAPSLHDVVGVSNDVGLSDVLEGRSADAALTEVSPLLTVLPGGHAVSGAIEALTAARMRQLLAEWSRRFDYVVISVPAFAAHRDVHLVLQLAHAIVFVIGAQTAPLPAIARAMASAGRDRIVGTILTGLDDDASGAAADGPRETGQ